MTEFNLSSIIRLPNNVCLMLSRLRHFMFGIVLKLLYNSFILPYLIYCNIVWCSTYPTHSSKLFILQKQSIRIVTNSSYNAHTNVLFCGLQILNVYNIFKLQVGEFMYNYFNRYLLDNFDNYFFLNSDVHGHYTRSSNLCNLFLQTNTLPSFDIIINFWSKILEYSAKSY